MYQKLKLCFMGSPQFSVPSLKILLEAGHDISVVYTQAPKPANRGKQIKKQPVHEYAERVGLKVLFSNNLKDNIQYLHSLNLDMIIVVAFGVILPKAIIDLPKLGCINLHASLLPRWRGAAPIQRAIMAGDKETGIGIMLMDYGLDTGAVIANLVVPINPKYSANDLTDELSIKGAILLEKSILKFANNLLNPIAQSTDGVTYANKIYKKDEIIDWNKKASEIINQIKALSPTPGAKCKIKDEIIKIIDAEVVECNLEIHNGVIIDDSMAVKCRVNAIKITLLQRPGKKIMRTKEVLNGWKISKGLKAQNIT
jgi:methionyl-tRNA formyltransferase